MQEDPVVILSFGEAIELCKKGTPVACTNMKSSEFIVLTPNQTITADKFWNEHNKAAAERNHGWLEVKPYFLKTNKLSTVPYTFSNEDIFADWVVASTRRQISEASLNEDGTLTLGFKALTEQQQKGIYPFWLLYSNLDMENNNIAVISTYHRGAARVTAVASIALAEYQTRNNALNEISFSAKNMTWQDRSEKQIIDGGDFFHPGNGVYLEEKLFDYIRELYDSGRHTAQFIIDSDSMIGLTAEDGTDLLTYVSNVLNKLAKDDLTCNWTPMSFKEETGVAFND